MELESQDILHMQAWVCEIFLVQVTFLFHKPLVQVFSQLGSYIIMVHHIGLEFETFPQYHQVL